MTSIQIARLRAASPPERDMGLRVRELISEPSMSPEAEAGLPFLEVGPLGGAIDKGIIGVSPAGAAGVPSGLTIVVVPWVGIAGIKDAIATAVCPKGPIDRRADVACALANNEDVVGEFMSPFLGQRAGNVVAGPT